MLQYVNSFTCTKNENTGTVVIQFLQNEPIVSETEDGELVTRIDSHHVISIVLEKDCADAFCASLTDLLEDDTAEDNS